MCLPLVQIERQGRVGCFFLLIFPCLVTVLYAYDAAGADELTIKPGDKVEVLSRGEGWWEGKLNGKIGQFPASYGTFMSLC